MWVGLFNECVSLLNKMSLYLLFGFLVAGIIHVFINEKIIGKHFGKHNLLSVVKASLFGIPLPLCSCSVVPTAISLKKDGASKGSILSFLISTPTTGIDSIFATYSLLGWLFTIFRVAASFFAGVLAGVLSVLFDSNEKTATISPVPLQGCCCHHHQYSPEHLTLRMKVESALRYAFFDLLEEVGGWLIAGIVIGGIISYFLPVGFIEQYLSSRWVSIMVMMVIGVPMYVCSSGSLPIAAALMLKGLSPAAAFVFLLVGPATNSASLTVIFKELGLKSTIFFLFSIFVTSVVFGLCLNYLWDLFDINLMDHFRHHSQLIPPQVEIFASFVLVGLILFHLVRRLYRRRFLSR